MIKIIAPIRGQDDKGNGAYLASRTKMVDGKVESYFHQGTDIACYPGSYVLPVKLGIVTKIGFPHDLDHPIKGHLRYVQVTDINGIDARYFYVTPLVSKGQAVGPNLSIGTCQDLTGIYPGITNHIHFEVKKEGKFLDPINYIEEAQL